MKKFDRFSAAASRSSRRDVTVRGQSVTSKGEPEATSVAARVPWRDCVEMVLQAWIVAMAQRACVDMPLLIDSVPNEVLRAALTGRSEARDD